MVIVDLPAEFSAEFLALIPAQRAYVNDLLGRGVLSGYALAGDRRRLWATVNAESRGDVDSVVDAFPLRRYMEVEVHELMFNQRPPHVLQIVSLN
jgi:muconolactone delta-isomerase